MALDTDKKPYRTMDEAKKRIRDHISRLLSSLLLSFLASAMYATQSLTDLPHVTHCRKVHESNKDWEQGRPTLAEVDARREFRDENNNGSMAGIRKAVKTGTYMPEWTLVSCASWCTCCPQTAHHSLSLNLQGSFNPRVDAAIHTIMQQTQVKGEGAGTSAAMNTVNAPEADALERAPAAACSEDKTGKGKQKKNGSTGKVNLQFMDA